MAGLTVWLKTMAAGSCLLLIAACAPAPALVSPTAPEVSSPRPTILPSPPADSTPPAGSPPPADSPPPAPMGETGQQRAVMVEGVTASMGIKDQRVIDAMNEVPRHEFVPPEYVWMAYDDTPLPIGYGQTISAPSIVAIMTELLELKPGEKVLEIGTGSGYQAAMLAQAEDVEVYTIEIVPELAASAAERLARLGYENIHVKQGDGYYGWEEYAPFDAIIVTAAPDHLPAPLVKQMEDGGRLVIPIGPAGGYQSLWKFVNQEGQLKAYNIIGVRFVPFTGTGIKQEEGDEFPLP